MQCQIHFIPDLCQVFSGLSWSELNPGLWAEVKSNSQTCFLTNYSHFQEFSTVTFPQNEPNNSEQSNKPNNLTKTSTHCGMCSQMRPCIVYAVNRISQVFIMLCFVQAETISDVSAKCSCPKIQQKPSYFLV